MQTDEECRKMAIESLAEELREVELDEGGVNLGSEDQYYALSFDEYAIDEVNDILREHGMELVLDHGQAFLNSL